MSTMTLEHPIFAAARAEHQQRGRPWIDTADVAKLIRLALGRAWPAVRFYVTMSRYAGGSSIRVAFDGVELDARGRALVTLTDYDGIPREGAPVITQDEIDYSAGRYGSIPRAGMPSKREVAAITDAFAGRAFDGYIDMAYSLHQWLNPDGSMTFAGTDGTEGSHGSAPAAYGSRRHPSAVLVHSGASYVFVDDELPYGHRAARTA